MNLRDKIEIIIKGPVLSKRHNQVIRSVLDQLDNEKKVYNVQLELIETLLSARVRKKKDLVPGDNHSEIILGKTNDPFLRHTRRKARKTVKDWTIIDNNECWIVQREPMRSGFPWLPSFGLAYRVSFWAYKGDIVLGMALYHTCKNKMCANPKHIEPRHATKVGGWY